ncbi:MAG: hypothetical protein PVI28_19695 [Gammaproteobacteria bacterium]|jgi:hypothetical protein
MAPSSDFIIDADRYASCIRASRRIRWDIDKDVLREKNFYFSEKFLPDSISRVDELDFLDPTKRTALSQIQGRTYANMFGLVERFICAKIMEVSRDHWLGSQIALESLVRFCDEELKHQELFRRIELMIGNAMPAGYRFPTDPNELARIVLEKCNWAVLALICLIELFTQAHYKESIAPDSNLAPLFKDVFLYHWREESQHAIMDEMEWQRENHKLTDSDRDQGMDDLLDLVTAIDRLLHRQANDDVRYLIDILGRSFEPEEIDRLRSTVLAAYRWQYIESGTGHPRFRTILSGMLNPAQANRIEAALAVIRG